MIETPVANGTGTVYAWGDNTNGQLGCGQVDVGRASAAGVAGLPPVVSIGSGSGHVFAQCSDGSLWGWGRNVFGQLGTASTRNAPAPERVIALRDVVQVAPGGGHTAFVLDDGTVWACGAGFFGAIGAGNADVQPVPRRVDGIDGVRMVAAGGAHTVALRTDGTVWTWGRDDHGQLGIAPDDQPDSDRVVRDFKGRRFPLRATPRRVAGLADVVSVTAGGGHNFALLGDGSVFSWGYNDCGQLGDGATVDRPVPRMVSGLPPVDGMAAAYHHTLAACKDGSVFAWGLNDGGQLGDGSTTNRTTPTQVSGLTAVAAVAASGGGTDENPGDGGHSVAMLADGSVYSWGYNDKSQLGDERTAYRVRPGAVPGLTGIRAVAAGGEVPQFRENPGGGYALALS